MSPVSASSQQEPREWVEPVGGVRFSVVRPRRAPPLREWFFFFFLGGGGGGVGLKFKEGLGILEVPTTRNYHWAVWVLPTSNASNVFRIWVVVKMMILFGAPHISGAV